MLSKNKKILLTIFIATACFICVWRFSNDLSQFNQDFKVSKMSVNGDKIDIASIVQMDNNGNRKVLSKIYLASNNWKSVDGINNDLNKLIKFYPDSFGNFELIVNALTIEAINLNSSNLDSLYVRMIWAEELKTYSISGENNSVVFTAISDYWMDFISNKLNELNKQDHWIKYEYRFRFLKTRLSHFNYFIGQGNSNFEKAILYFIDNRWVYLADRFYHGTSMVLKIVLIFSILITVYAYFCLAQKHFLNRKH